MKISDARAQPLPLLTGLAALARQGHRVLGIAPKKLLQSEKPKIRLI